MASLVIIGGYAPKSFEMNIKAYDRIIAADSGYDTAKTLSIVPDLVVGDFDSTKYAEELIAKGYKQMPRDKDESDTELALMSLDKDSAYDILGGGEGRVDHLLSIMSLFKEYGYPRYWFTRVDTIITIIGKRIIKLPINTELSLFSIYGANVSTSGLVWDLEARELDQSFLSLSNRTREEEISIICDRPILLRLNPNSFSSFAFDS